MEKCGVTRFVNFNIQHVIEQNYIESQTKTPTIIGLMQHLMTYESFDSILAFRFLLLTRG